MSEDRFYIGQDVVCVKTHSRSIVKEGEVYTIKSLRSCCSCVPVMIDVGKTKQEYVTNGCGKCCYILPPSTTLWLGAALFKPLDSLTNIEELTEILEQPIEQLFEVKENCK